MARLSDPAVIACSLEQSQFGETRKRWLDLSERAHAATTPTESGLQFTFRPLPGVEDELHSLIALERQCCSFATWSIRHDDGLLVVDISADSDDAIAAIQGMFRAS